MFLFYIPFQSGALVYTTSCSIATLYNLIAILLLHLQALYNIIILTFIIAMSLFLKGVRTQHTNIWRGIKWTAQLLYSYKQRLVNLTYIRPKVFKKLFNQLQPYSNLKDIKLLIFLIIFSNNSLYRLLSKMTCNGTSLVTNRNVLVKHSTL